MSIKTKKRIITVDTGNQDEEDEMQMGIMANKQARKRAEENQDYVNGNKRRKNIAAHQEHINFEIPLNDAQTNHCFFYGKETKNNAMEKARQTQIYNMNKAVKDKTQR